MRNVLRIFRRDVANLFRNVMSVIITVGLIVLPSLFAWYNILACWDVFGNTGNLSVAVANSDKGYTSDIMPLDVNVGGKVVDALRANSQINWVITDQDDAIEGTKSGKYYAALVIPENFSSQMLTFYEGDSRSATINYYVNEKKNAISPNITGAGADTVSAEINKGFADAVSEVAAGVAKSLGQYADESNLDDSVALLMDRTRNIAVRLDQSADALGLYATLSKDSQSLVQNTSNLIENARAQADSALANVGSDKQALSELAARLSSAANTLSSSIDTNKAALKDVEDKVNAALNNMSTDAADAAGKIRAKATELDSQISELNTQKAELEKLRDDLHNALGDELDKVISAGSSVAEIRASVEVVMERTSLLDKSIDMLATAIDTLQQAADGLNEAADSVESGADDARQKVTSLQQKVVQAQADVDSLKTDFETNLKPDLDKLKTDLQAFIGDLDAVAVKLNSLSTNVPRLGQSVGSTLGEVEGKIGDAGAKLRTAASNIRDLADSVDAALASGDMDTVRSLLSGNVEDIATALSAPVHIERTALFPVQNFGTAMSPLYSTLAVFIGALLIMVALKPEVSERGEEGLVNLKPRQLYLGRFGVVSLLSLLQTSLLGLGNMLFVKVQVDNPLLFMLCFWIAGLVFAFIIYTLVTAFGNLGKGIAVLLLIVQVTACGGSYPLQILPDFVQQISPFVPATHVVDALRAAMFGVFQNDYWISIGKLALFVVPFLFLGLVLRRPVARFMHFYVSKVEESKLM